MNRIQVGICIATLLFLSCKSDPTQPSQFVGEELQQTGTLRRLNSVLFRDKNTGSVVGDGIILTTSDGGAHWVRVPIDSLLDYSAIGQLQSQLFFIGVTSFTRGPVYCTIKTADPDFDQISLYETTSGGLYGSFVPLSGSELLFVGTNVFAPFGASAALFRVGSSSAEWQRIDSFIMPALNIARFTSGLMLNDSILLCGTYEFHTPDDSAQHNISWNLIPIYKLNLRTMVLDSMNVDFWDGMAHPIMALSSAGAAKLVAASVNMFFVSSDDGANWEPVSSPVNDKSIIDMVMSTDKIGFACGQGGLLLRTNDGGLSWFNVDSKTTHDLYKLSIPDFHNAWVVGDSGTIIRIGI